MFEVTREFSDPVCVKTLYCALARPIPENCSIVWCASAEVWKKIMERMHRKFTCFAIWLLQWSDSSTLSPYQSRRSLLGLETLADRRRNVRKLLFTADLLCGKDDCPEILKQINLNVNRSTTRNQQLLRTKFRNKRYGFI